MDKVVLAWATGLQLAASLDAVSIMAADRRSNLNCFHLLMAFNTRQAFFGSMPGRLWHRRGALLRIGALTGAVANHREDAKAQQLVDWLMKGDKNQRENMLVVEDIYQRLQNEASTLDVLPPQVVKLRRVQRLRRCIQTELGTPDDSRCLLQLQPTVAMAGLLRRATLAFIQRRKPFTREWYARSAGYLSLAQSGFCVALRSAKVDHDTLRLYAGVEVINGSDVQQEWQEIDNKAAGLRSLLCP